MRELDWFDGPEDPTEAGRRRPRWFPLLVAAPWLVVAAFLVAPQLGRNTAEVGPASRTASTTVEDPTVGAGRNDDDPLPTAADDPTPGSDPERASTSERPPAGTPELLAAPEVIEIQELRGRWRVAPGSEEAASLAVVIARAWLTGVGPPLLIPGIDSDSTDYAEHLVVEAVERTSADTAVVTVVAVVLREGENTGSTVTVERLAVPITFDDTGPRPGGIPWPLPGPRLDPVLPTLTSLEDDGTAWDGAVAALARAGLGTLQLVDLQQATDGPLVATVTDGSDRYDVWLRTHVDGYVVAGTTLEGAAQAEPDEEG